MGRMQPPCLFVDCRHVCSSSLVQLAGCEVSCFPPSAFAFTLASPPPLSSLSGGACHPAACQGLRHATGPAAATAATTPSSSHPPSGQCGERRGGQGGGEEQADGMGGAQRVTRVCFCHWEKGSCEAHAVLLKTQLVNGVDNGAD